MQHIGVGLCCHTNAIVRYLVSTALVIVPVASYRNVSSEVLCKSAPCIGVFRTQRVIYHNRPSSVLIATSVMLSHNLCQFECVKQTVNKLEDTC